MNRPGTPSIADTDVRFRVGTLRYTKAGLALVFVWLLWGDFVFTLMESVAPSIVPLRLKELGISDQFLPIITVRHPQFDQYVAQPDHLHRQ